MNEFESDATHLDAFREWLAGLDRRGKRALWIALALFGSVWLSGALLAPNTVAGIGRLPPLSRAMAALCFGGFSWLWMLMKQNGNIQESAQRPFMLWIGLGAILPVAVWGFLWLLLRKVDPATQMKRRMEALDRSQGHVSAEQLAKTCAVGQGIPLAYVTTRKRKKVRVGLGLSAESHIFAVAPTGRGKSLHLTDVLLSYPGAVLVVDPKGEQLARTAAARSRWGPIYRFPGHEICLADYYDRLLDRDSMAELHYHLLRPWQDRESVFAEKSLSLFTAVALYAEAHDLDPIRVLLDLAESDPVLALAAMERVAAARRHVRIFTNGASPDGFQEDRFATSAFGTFTTRLARYQKHVDTIAPSLDGSSYGRRRLLDPDWIKERGTIYLTYDLHSMQGAGGVISALIAGVLRQHARRSGPGRGQRVLLAVDELAHVGLGNLATYLATVRSAGVMFLLYAQNLEQLDELYGRNGTEKIVGNCDHQLWYSPNTPRMGQRLSELYGKTFRSLPTHSASQGMRNHRDRDGRAATQTSAQQGASAVWRESPHLSAEQFLALPRDQVLVKMMTDKGKDAGTPYIFIGERLNSIPLFEELPGPELLHLPEPRSAERTYTDWTESSTGQRATTPPAAATLESEEMAATDTGSAAEDEADIENTHARQGAGTERNHEVRTDNVDTTAENKLDATDEPTAPAVSGMF